MKVCPYCLGAHSQRGRYCGPNHARLAANERQRAYSRLRRTFARAARRRQQLAVTNSLYRDAATGRKSVEQLVAEVFGVSEIPAMRDTSE